MGTQGRSQGIDGALSYNDGGVMYHFWACLTAFQISGFAYGDQCDVQHGSICRYFGDDVLESVQNQEFEET